MIDTVKSFILENNLENKTLLVGFSGGIDSSVLVDILSKIKNINLIAIHLNHNWRKEESKRDENFAKEFANSRGIKFYSETLSSDIKQNETEAREARYNFFEKCKNKFQAEGVFLAHNKNDNVETLIYRLIKGTGIKGATSILKIRDFYYRPLIDHSREQIEEYAKNNGLKFVLDSSNNNNKYKRNLIRNEIIPLMKKINPEVINSINSFIKLASLDFNIIESVISETKKEVFDNDRILLEKFLNLKYELQLEIMNSYLQGVLKNRDFKTIKRIVDFIKNNKSSKLSISKDKFLKIYDGKIYLVEKVTRNKVFETPFNFSQTDFLNYTFKPEEVTPPAVFPKNDSLVQFVSLDKNKNYTLRTRKQGDVIIPFGLKTKQKLKTFFIKKKIPLELRDKIPMIALGNEILYIPNLALSEKLRVDKNDKICYKLTVIKKD